MRGRSLAGAIALAAAAGCYSGAGAMTDTEGSGVNPTGSGGATTTSGDLPCDVAQLLQSKCDGCHGTTPSGGAPMSLVTYADLTAQAKSDPTKSVAEMCVARMQSTTSPMPPGSAPSPAADVAVIQAWISGGMQKGTCGTGSGAVDACASGRTYGGGGDGSSVMNPGQACISCHQESGGEAPHFAIAGTVYQTAHEPDMCDGVSAGAASVVITDANGAVVTIQVNSAGNFYYRGAIAMPYGAKVVANGKERAMSAHQTSGDCNSCHTVSGANGAPGRIMAP